MKGGERLDLEESILKNVRKSVGLMEDNKEFDTELINHVNMTLGKLYQNGVGVNLIIESDAETWGDLINETQYGSEYAGMIPTFISLNVKLLFDPPPPSAVEFHTRSIDELLWRLRVAYQEVTVIDERRT